MSDSEPKSDLEVAPLKARILVVYDDMEQLTMLRENFLMEGYAVMCADDRQEALQLARQETPDLIVLDLRMPMTNGLMTLKYLRAYERTAQIPVIFISGDYSDANLAEIALT